LGGESFARKHARKGTVLQDNLCAAKNKFQRVGDNITVAEAAEELQKRCAVQTAALPRVEQSAMK
jgi:hypothetical protein